MASLRPKIRQTRRLKRIQANIQLKFRKLHVRKGDLVKVLCGKDRGKTGKIIQVIPEKNAVRVEKVNVAKRHQKPNQRVAKGSIIERENPIHVSNVQLVHRQDEDGVRTSEGKRRKTEAAPKAQPAQ